jgi:hypothetical protein
MGEGGDLVAKQMAEWAAAAEQSAGEKNLSPSGTARAQPEKQHATVVANSVWGLGAQKGQAIWRTEPPESSNMGAARGAVVKNDSEAAEQAARGQRVQMQGGEQSAACLSRDAEMALQLMVEDAAAHGVSRSAALLVQTPRQGAPAEEGVQTSSKGKEKVSSLVPTYAEQDVALAWERQLSEGAWRRAEELAPVVLQPQLDPVAVAAARAHAMACFAAGRPMVAPSERDGVEGVPYWIDNSAKVVKVMTAKGWWAPERVLLDGGSYYSMAGARLTVRLGLSDADLDSKEHRVQTAMGKVETLRGGLTKEAVPVVLNAGTADEICLFKQLAPTESTGYDLLIGTRAAYPCGLSVDRWTEQGVYRVDWRTVGEQIGKLPMKLHQAKADKWVQVVRQKGRGGTRGGAGQPRVLPHQLNGGGGRGAGREHTQWGVLQRVPHPPKETAAWRSGGCSEGRQTTGQVAKGATAGRSSGGREGGGSSSAGAAAKS